MSDSRIVIDGRTVAFVRTVHAASLLLIQAGSDRTQQEVSLRMIIEACNDELIYRGMEDESHSRLSSPKPEFG